MHLFLYALLVVLLYLAGILCGLYVWWDSGSFADGAIAFIAWFLLGAVTATPLVIYEGFFGRSATRHARKERHCR